MDAAKDIIEDEIRVAKAEWEKISAQFQAITKKDESRFQRLRLVWRFGLKMFRMVLL